MKKRLLASVLLLMLAITSGKAAGQGDSLWHKIQGDWYQPHDFEILEAIIDINFHSDSTFVFNCYNEKTESVERLTGTYETRGKSKIILHYPDGTKEKMEYKENVPTLEGTFTFISSKKHQLQMIRP